MHDEVEKQRNIALHLAITVWQNREVHAPGHTIGGQIIATAERFFIFLTEAAPAHRLLFSIGLITDQKTGEPSPNQYHGGILTMKDTEQVDITVEAEDSKGQPTADTLNWSMDQAGTDSGATFTVSADTMTATVVAGNPGTATMTATDPNGLSGVSAVVVTAGDAATLVLTQGTPTPQV